MSGPINIGSTAEWQSLLSSTNVVITDCTPAFPIPLKLTNTPQSTPTGAVPAR